MLKIDFEKIGQIIFAIGITVLGCLCFYHQDFIVGRPPAFPDTFAFKSVIGYIGGVICILSGASILLRVKMVKMMWLLLIALVLCSFSRNFIWFKGDLGNFSKTLALIGGTYLMAQSLAKSSLFANPKTDKTFFWVALTTLSLFFFWCGYAHFAFFDFVCQFIPSYIPFHTFWAAFCGICLIAAGIGFFLPKYGKWAALLSGFMILGWFLLLHIPRFLSNSMDKGDQMGLFESLTFVGVFFVLNGLLKKSESTSS